MKPSEKLNLKAIGSAKESPKRGQATIYVPEGFPKPEGKPKKFTKPLEPLKLKDKAKLAPLTKGPMKTPVKTPIKTKEKPKPAPPIKTKPSRPTRYKAKPAPIKKGRKKSKSILPSLFDLPWPLGLMVLAGILLGVNFGYQVMHKPTEIVGLFESNFHKTPRETWRSYHETFKSKATSIMKPDLLAALAQMESNGNPIVRTYWRWRWNRDVSKIFAPASSAVGMFQITEGTFNEAKHFCVKDGVPYQDSSREEFCLGNFTYSRLVPAHAIEMTSARLHLVAEHLLGRWKKRGHWSLQDKQDIAIITHLCGAGKAERLVRSGMRMTELGKCGDHNPVAYTHQIHRLQAQFKSIEANRLQLASLEDN